MDAIHVKSTRMDSELASLMPQTARQFHPQSDTVQTGQLREYMYMVCIWYLI